MRSGLAKLRLRTVYFYPILVKLIGTVLQEPQGARQKKDLDGKSSKLADSISKKKTDSTKTQISIDVMDPWLV